MDFTLHHTCDAEGEIADISKPFLSTHTQATPKALGTGYYFFDNNSTMAHAHGKNRCRRKYYIFELKMQIKANFLDLVGNRNDIIFLQGLMEKFRPYLKKDEEWSLGRLVELARSFVSEEFNFPYQIIRIIDSSLPPEKVSENFRLSWFPEKKYSEQEEKPKTQKFINLNPVFTVCFSPEYDFSGLNFAHIHTNKK